VLWFGGHDQNQPSESASPGSALMVQRVERWRARLESEIVGRAARERVFTTWAEGNEANEANEANVKAGVTQADNVGEGRSEGRSEGKSEGRREDGGPPTANVLLSLHVLAPLLRRELGRCRQQQAMLSTSGSSSGSSSLRERVQAQRAVPGELTAPSAVISLDPFNSSTFTDFCPPLCHFLHLDPNPLPTFAPLPPHIR
jgi:hypothetical protein